MTKQIERPGTDISSSKFISSIHILLTICFAAILIISPVAIDYVHMDDTVLLANVGWRGIIGYEPVIDYPHFYGGFTESFVTLSFALFGASYKSIDYAFVMLFGVSALFAFILCWRRITAVEIGLVTVLSAGLIMSLDPIEGFEHFDIGHSYVYNHVGVVLMLALTVFACIKIEDHRTERLSAAAAGIIFYALMLVKATFGLIGISVIVACLLQKRWISAGLLLAGATVAMLALDPAMARVLGSAQSLITSDAAAQAGGFEGRLFIASMMVGMQAVPLAIVLILSFVLMRRRKWSSLPLIGSLFVCGLGYSAAMLATGGNPQLKLLPFFIVASLILSKALTDEGPYADARQTNRSVIRLIPVAFCYSLVLPAFATSAVGLFEALDHKDASLVENGPLSRYVVLDKAEDDTRQDVRPRKARLASATVDSLRRIRAGEVTERDEYVMFADGINLLRQVPDVASYGIISNGRMFDFTASLQSKIVVSYPVWPMASSPDFATRKPLGPDVDLVMMLDEVPALELVSDPLRSRMREEFRPCRRSAFWTLFVRRGVKVNLCDGADAMDGAISATSRA